jgi:hypothetical protein
VRLKAERWLLRAAGELPMSGFDLAQAHHAFRKGYSLILNRLNDRWPPVARLCAQVASDLGFPTNANLYVTPANSQGKHAAWLAEPTHSPEGPYRL